MIKTWDCFSALLGISKTGFAFVFKRRLTRALGPIAALVFALSACSETPIEESKTDFKNCGRAETVEAAIAACTRIILRNRDSDRWLAAAHYSRGVHHFGEERYHNAIHDFSRTIELHPDGSVAYPRRAIAYQYTAQFERGIADLEAILKETPEDSVLQNHLAWVLSTSPDVRVHDGERAILLAQKAIRKLPNYSYVDTMAAAYAAAGRFPEAAHEQRRAILLLRAAGQSTNNRFGQEFQNRLTLYLGGQVYKEPSPQVRHVSQEWMDSQQVSDTAAVNDKFAPAAPEDGATPAN